MATNIICKSWRTWPVLRMKVTSEWRRLIAGLYRGYKFLEQCASRMKSCSMLKPLQWFTENRTSANFVFTVRSWERSIDSTPKEQLTPETLRQKDHGSYNIW